jgi:hypothetical protein
MIKMALFEKGMLNVILHLFYPNLSPILSQEISFFPDCQERFLEDVSTL